MTANSYRCHRCKDITFGNPFHRCPPQWVAVLPSVKEPPTETFTWESVDNDEDVFAHTADAAAEIACARYDAEAGERQDERIVGVIPFDKLLGLSEPVEDEASRLIDPSLLSWFRVECFYEPTYAAESITP